MGAARRTAGGNRPQQAKTEVLAELNAKQAKQLYPSSFGVRNAKGKGI